MARNTNVQFSALAVAISRCASAEGHLAGSFGTKAMGYRKYDFPEMQAKKIPRGHTLMAMSSLFPWEVVIGISF